MEGVAWARLTASWPLAPLCLRTSGQVEEGVAAVGEIDVAPGQVGDPPSDGGLPRLEISVPVRPVTVLIRVLELVERRIFGIQQRSVPREEVLVDHLGQGHVTTPVGSVWITVQSTVARVRRSIDDARDDHPFDEERPPASWMVGLTDDCDGCGDIRVVVTLEEAGRAGTGVVAHLGPAGARRMRAALAAALRELGEDPGP
jgi:hypothetical protein